jgi:hypothetical protein
MIGCINTGFVKNTLDYYLAASCRGILKMKSSNMCEFLIQKIYVLVPRGTIEEVVMKSLILGLKHKTLMYFPSHQRGALQ